MPTRIGIVDDNQFLIDALRQNLSIFEEVEVTFTAKNGKDAIEKVKINAPDAILMDIEMPEMDGIEATQLIKKIAPQVKVIMLTVFDQEDKIFEAILGGAIGYLLKDEKPAKILEAISQALEGGAPMSPSIAAKALDLIRWPDRFSRKPPEDFSLTPREIEILEQMAEGLGYQQVASKLFISPKTVRKHIENIYEKLQVHSKVDAVKVGLKNKWF